MIEWLTIEIVSQPGYVHPFVMDYATGLLANLLIVNHGLVYLESR
jgi:hypothetical protein